MQKIVLDTNVLVSSLIQRNYPYFIVNDLFIEKKIKLCVSNELLTEYHEVLNRKKFSKYPHFLLHAEILLANIEENSAKFKPKTRLHIIKDVDDNKLLELAAESKADFLITGNINDFTMKTYRKTKIVTPAVYWDLFRP